MTFNIAKTAVNGVMRSAGFTVAEGSFLPNLLTNTNLIIKNETLIEVPRKLVLRTCFDPIEVWRAKHNFPQLHTESTSGVFKGESKTEKWFAEINNDLWFFGIDGTNPDDIITSVQGLMHYTHSRMGFTMTPGEILGEVYIKNLNAERESDLSNIDLIKQNKQLYEATFMSVVDAAKALNVLHDLDIYVYSNNRNPKISGGDILDAMNQADATRAFTYSKRIKQQSQSNDATAVTPANMVTNLHMGTFSTKTT